MRDHGSILLVMKGGSACVVLHLYEHVCQGEEGKMGMITGMKIPLAPGALPKTRAKNLGYSTTGLTGASVKELGPHHLST